MQKLTPIVAPQSQTKTPATPVVPSAPLPIDPSLLRQISGGTQTSSPNPTW